MGDEKLASRPPLMRPHILNLTKCGGHEIYSEFEQLSIKPSALRVLQDNELNKVVYAECWGFGAGVKGDETTGLEMGDSILARKRRLDESEE